MKKLFYIYALIVFGTFIAIAFHGENTTGLLDWYIHNVSAYVIGTAFGFVLFNTFDSLEDKWFNK